MVSSLFLNPRIWSLIPVLVAPTTLAAQDLDMSALNSVDVLAQEIGTGTGATALEYHNNQDPWLGGYLTLGGVDATDASDLDTVIRGPVLGYNLGWQNVSLFIGYGQGEADLSDDITQARIRSYFWGVSTAGQYANIAWGAALYTGGTHNKIVSPSTLYGSADYDGRLVGLAVEGSGFIWENPMEQGTGLDFSVQANVLHHQIQGYTLSGTGTQVDERSTLSSSLKLEAGLPFKTHSTNVRPYISYTFRAGEAGDFDVTNADGTETLEPGDTYLTTDIAAIGLAVHMPNLRDLQSRLEIAHEDSANPRYSLSIGMSF